MTLINARAAALPVFGIAVLIGGASPAAAQNWSFDARHIAIGGVGDMENVARTLVEEEHGYRSIVLPFGLIQVLEDTSIFNPDDDNFDPVRAGEYAASPLHYTFGRRTSGGGQRFVKDIVNAELSRDLNAYRGFTPASELTAEGLASPSWGKTFRMRQQADGSFHGLYVGAGPYLSIQTANRIDQGLIDLLGSSTNTYVPNAHYLMTDDTVDQAAVAITGGYRARLPLPGRAAAPGGRDGIYVAANYNYLHGFHYDDLGLVTRLDTDGSGLVTLAPTTTPVSVERITSKRGAGFALDFGLAFVVNRWDFGFGAAGVANRIRWQRVEREAYVLQSLFAGGDFVQSPRLPLSEERHVELPVNYTTDLGYRADTWSALIEYGHGFQGNNVHGGVEYRFDRIEFRGGARYTRDRWQPSGGVGFNFTRRFSIDLAAFGTSTNIERERRLAVAASLRFNPTSAP